MGPQWDHSTVEPWWDRTDKGATEQPLEQVGAAVLDPRFLLPRAVSSWPAWGAGVLLQLDNLDVEGGKGDLVGRRASRKKLRQP